MEEINILGPCSYMSARACSPDIISVNVYDKETQRNFTFDARHDRLRNFYALAVERRRESELAYMPGVSPAAVRGLQAIFLTIPSAFRLENFLEYLVQEQTIYGPQAESFTPTFWDRVFKGQKPVYRALLDPPLTVKEVEGVLEEFGKQVDSLYTTSVGYGG